MVSNPYIRPECTINVKRSFISRIYQIPTKSRLHIPPSIRSRATTIVIFTVIIILVAIIVANVMYLWTVNNPDWSWTVHDPPLNYASIDEDFILFNRPFINVSEYAPYERMGVIDVLNHKNWLYNFRLRDDETAIWRDCTVHTLQASLGELSRLGYTRKLIEVDGGQYYTNLGLELAEEIILTGSANLTLINVMISASADIRLYDTASLKMVNCTNIGYGWSGGGESKAISRYTMGRVVPQDNATVWIEDSTLGVLIGYCDSVNVIRSSIKEVRIGSGTPPQFIDSEVYEMYTDRGDVNLVGTTHVDYLFDSVPLGKGPLEHAPSIPTGRGRDISFKMEARADKTEYMLGEPVNVTVRMENMGLKTLTLDFNGSDSFNFRINRYTENPPHTLVYTYVPDHSSLPTPSVVEPGWVIEWTLTWWQDPPVPPDHYAISCSLNSTTLRSHSLRGYPDFTISEEKWQE